MLDTCFRSNRNLKNVLCSTFKHYKQIQRKYISFEKSENSRFFGCKLFPMNVENMLSMT